MSGDGKGWSPGSLLVPIPHSYKTHSLTFSMCFRDEFGWRRGGLLWLDFRNLVQTSRVKKGRESHSMKGPSINLKLLLSEDRLDEGIGGLDRVSHLCLNWLFRVEGSTVPLTTVSLEFLIHSPPLSVSDWSSTTDKTKSTESSSETMLLSLPSSYKPSTEVLCDYHLIPLLCPLFLFGDFKRNRAVSREIRWTRTRRVLETLSHILYRVSIRLTLHSLDPINSWFRVDSNYLPTNVPVSVGSWRSNGTSSRLDREHRSFVFVSYHP